MKKLFRASCAALAVCLITIPVFADLIDPFYGNAHPYDAEYFYEEPISETSLVILALALGAVIIAAAILARVVIRKRKERKEAADK